MKKEAIFCDFCREYIEDSNEGKVFFFSDTEHSRLSEREFKMTTFNK